MSKIIVITGRAPAEVDNYARQQGAAHSHFWPEIRGDGSGLPRSAEALLVLADAWVYNRASGGNRITTDAPDRWCGGDILIVTGSTLLVSRLRRHVAEGVLEAAQLEIVRVVQGVGVPVTVNEYGAIRDWPHDWMDHDVRESDAILQAAMNRIHKEEDGGGRNTPGA